MLLYWPLLNQRNCILKKSIYLKLRHLRKKKQPCSPFNPNETRKTFTSKKCKDKKWEVNPKVFILQTHKIDSNDEYIFFLLRQSSVNEVIFLPVYICFHCFIFYLKDKTMWLNFCQNVWNGLIHLTYKKESGRSLWKSWKIVIFFLQTDKIKMHKFTMLEMRYYLMV